METETQAINSEAIEAETPEAAPAPYKLRITSKALKHPDTGKVLRANFEPVDVNITLPSFTLDDAKLAKVMAALYADAVKGQAQAMERAAWINGENPFNPAKSAEVRHYFQKLVDRVTVDTIHDALFGERTRNGGLTVARWRAWIAKTFVEALNCYYASQGKPLLSGPKLAATIALLGQGRNMAAHNKSAFIARFTEMLESDNARILELLTSDESREAFEWITYEEKPVDDRELEI
jgi:hypothetical protein